MARPASSSEAADKAKQVARENGIANPSALSIGPIFAPLYIAFVPLTTYLSRLTLTRAPLDILLRLIPGTTPTASSALAKTLLSSSTTFSPTLARIPALAALYTFVTFGASGAFSAAGQAMAREEGLDNNEPRKHTHKMEGLPYRLRAAHMHLMENFPGWALAAALTVAMGAGLAQEEQEVLTGLLGLHVFLKLLVYYPAYLANIPPPRTLSHVLATASVINVCWRLAKAAALVSN